MRYYYDFWFKLHEEKYLFLSLLFYYVEDTMECTSMFLLQYYYNYFQLLLIIFTDFYDTMGGWREFILYELLKTNEEKGK